MRSRYAAYVLQQTDYIVSTTAPAQQALLNRPAIHAWIRSAEWLSLTVLQHRTQIGKYHAQVEFEARFCEQGEIRVHRELSAFVNINGSWYFIDPTVQLPDMKTPCFCGSGKNSSSAAGSFLENEHACLKDLP